MNGCRAVSLSSATPDNAGSDCRLTDRDRHGIMKTMQTSRTGVVLLTAMTLAVTALASGTDIARYSVIWDRFPFGQPAPAVPAAAAAAAANQVSPAAVFASYRLCYIGWDEANGVTCAILDNKTGVPNFLRVGESLNDGTLLADADYDDGSALLRKDGVELWLYVGGSKGATAGVAQPQVAATTAASSPIPNLPPGIQSRRRNPAERMVRRRVVPPPVYKGEQLEKHLQNYQMDLIRSTVLEDGEKGPPLPMELTPEMDDQLVSEGVLPPAE